ncbi:hypothetical protein SDC9_126409 [bioreactor metagenome]|uniref:Uncharacterized protein n=1 Tax=bioreactor metagenome TaxID=1076179 RepID=A0A645CQN0_9ZZZZ
MPNATLVFASDRPNGKGKLDLYAASIIINDVIQTEIPFTVSATNLNVEINKLTKYDLVADTTIITENTQEISFSTLPPAIQFFVKIDSIYFQNTIKQNSKDYKIIYKLIADNKLLEEKEFDILKKDFIINIENHSNKIFEADILEIEVSIKILSSKECNIISKKNTINIAKSEKNELKKHKSGSEEYYRVLTIVNNNIDTYKLENTEILSEIKNLIEFSPKINIFINNADTKFTNEIKKIFNNNRNINIVKPSDEQLQYIEYHIFLAR